MFAGHRGVGVAACFESVPGARRHFERPPRRLVALDFECAFDAVDAAAVDAMV